ncbi:Trpc4-associated protein [Mytilus galloprovincialis]|uniref:Trpc4-associated protein n=1 Tax=Mytilus galloprovincialis TaxID=29158 RepID=A0A8B6E2I2_MYTGA|nr:Trpc4-associated protein [Mytilus galloprovincialis]
MIRHKKRTFPSKSSVFLAQEQWQYSGNAYKRLSQLPEHVIEEIGEGSGIPEIVAELDYFSTHMDADDDLCLENLKTLLGNLMNFEPRRSNEESNADDEQQKYAAQFYEHGGVEVLMRILMFNTQFPQACKNIKVGYPESDLLLRIKSLVLEILTKISTTSIGDHVINILMEDDEVLNYVFTLLSHTKTFINACQLVEDMLQSKRQVLDLHRITNIKTLILSLTDSQLANFCRILAVAISDLDIYENKSSLFAQNKQKRSRGFVNVRDINQELLLGIPELLPRLVNLAVMKDCEILSDFKLKLTNSFRAAPLNQFLKWWSERFDQELFLKDNQERNNPIKTVNMNKKATTVMSNILFKEMLFKLQMENVIFDKFTSTVNRNLVDSNMFIRSLILSLEHLTNDESPCRDYAKKENKLLMYIGDFNKQLDYLYKLIKIINVQNLTQENVSCLNTTLVFLMFANRKNQLPRYLQALRDEKEDMMDVSGCTNLLRNFRDLLIFWQDHYLHKDKDCSALEKSSRISFDYWKQTVSILVDENKDLTTGILHYITPIPCDRPN